MAPSWMRYSASMPRGSSRWNLVLISTAVFLLVAGLAIRWRLRQLEPHASVLARVQAPQPSPSPEERAGDVPDPLNEQAYEDDPLTGMPDREAHWASVDMEKIREALPDNIYWKMAAPTNDPQVKEAREQERARWNDEYGKVLSNTATDAEIDAYYAHRQKLSEDYLAFIVYLMENYGYQIPRRDVALLKLAGEMHHERLEELPRQLAEAHQRHAEHESVRAAWLEQQKQFGAQPPSDPNAPPPDAQ